MNGVRRLVGGMQLWTKLYGVDSSQIKKDADNDCADFERGLEGMKLMMKLHTPFGIAAISVIDCLLGQDLLKKTLPDRCTHTRISLFICSKIVKRNVKRVAHQL